MTYQITPDGARYAVRRTLRDQLDDLRDAWEMFCGCAMCLLRRQR